MCRCGIVAGIVLLLTTLPLQAQNPPGNKPPADPPRPPALQPDDKPGTTQGDVQVPATMSISEYQGKSLTQLLHDLKTVKDPSVLEEYLNILPAFGEALNNPEVLTTIIYCCDEKNNRDAASRIRTIQILNILPIKPADRSRVVQTLNARLQDSQSQARYYAALGLIRFGEDAKPAINHLVTESMNPATFSVRQACLTALMVAGHNSKGPPDPRAVDAMVNAANKDFAVAVRLEAVKGIGILGRPETPKQLDAVVQALIARLKDRDHRVIIWANVSLMSINGKVDDVKVEAIATLLRNPEVHVRQHAALAMASMGPSIKGKVGVSRLIDALNDKDPSVALMAIGALVSIGDKNETVLAALKDVKERKDGPQALNYFAETAIQTLTGKKPEKPEAKK